MGRKLLIPFLLCLSLRRNLITPMRKRSGIFPFFIHLLKNRANRKSIMRSRRILISLWWKSRSFLLWVGSGEMTSHSTLPRVCFLPNHECRRRLHCPTFEPPQTQLIITRDTQLLNVLHKSTNENHSLIRIIYIVFSPMKIRSICIYAIVTFHEFFLLLFVESHEFPHVISVLSSKTIVNINRR